MWYRCSIDRCVHLFRQITLIIFAVGILVPTAGAAVILNDAALEPAEFGPGSY
jgi:hypothetical protein